jgi:hypothetical protein
MDKIFSGTPINLTIGRFANEPIVSGFIRTMILKEISRKDNLPVSLNEIRLKIFSNGKYLFDDKFMESINYTTDILCELNEFLSIGYMEIDESVEAYGYSEIIKWIF